MKRVVVQHFSVILLLITTAVVSCTSAPTQEMSDARQAIKVAREIKADLYAPVSLTKASDKLAIAQQNLENDFFSIARHQAIAAKEQAVMAYSMAIAIDRAKQVWQILLKMGDTDNEVNELLSRAEQASRQDDVQETLFQADQAYRQATIKLNQIYLKQAKVLLDEAKVQQASFNESQRLILTAALAAYFRGEGDKSYQLIIQLVKPNYGEQRN